MEAGWFKLKQACQQYFRVTCSSLPQLQRAGCLPAIVSGRLCPDFQGGAPDAFCCQRGQRLRSEDPSVRAHARSADDEKCSEQRDDDCHSQFRIVRRAYCMRCEVTIVQLLPQFFAPMLFYGKSSNGFAKTFSCLTRYVNDPQSPRGARIVLISVFISSVDGEFIHDQPISRSRFECRSTVWPLIDNERRHNEPYQRLDEFQKSRRPFRKRNV